MSQESARRNRLIVLLSCIGSLVLVNLLARDHFVTLGGNLLSSIKLGVMPHEKVQARLTISGREHGDSLHDAGFAVWIQHDELACNCSAVLIGYEAKLFARSTLQ